MITLQPFPKLENSNDDGLLAMGGDLSISTLVSAYAQGIFPWFNEGQPILWWSPDPRLVLYPDKINLSRSLKKSIKNKYHVSCNQAFKQVIDGCALRGQTVSQANQSNEANNTWITQDMHMAYTELHHNGYAHSVEVWQGNELVGGLYGVSLGSVFFGESMFSRQADASKTALAYLCQHLLNLEYKLIDCQIASTHLLTLGAIEIPRKEFASALVDIDINQPKPDFADGFPQQPHELNSLFSLKNDIKDR